MTAGSAEAGRTATHERVDVVEARGAVDARVRRAFIDVRLTVTTSEPRRALAPVVSHQVHTLGAVTTRP